MARAGFAKEDSSGVFYLITFAPPSHPSCCCAPQASRSPVWPVEAVEVVLGRAARFLVAWSWDPKPWRLAAKDGNPKGSLSSSWQTMMTRRRRDGYALLDNAVGKVGDRRAGVLVQFDPEKCEMKKRRAY